MKIAVLSDKEISEIPEYYCRDCAAVFPDPINDDDEYQEYDKAICCQCNSKNVVKCSEHDRFIECVLAYVAQLEGRLVRIGYYNYQWPMGCGPC